MARNSRWRRLGHVFVANGQADWMQSHAMLPTPLLMGQTIRVYVAFCDRKMVGRIGYVELRADNPTEVVGISKEPVLDIGLPGAFDDHGVNPATIIERDGELWLYYIGWQLGNRVRYTLYTGLAVSQDGGHFFRRQLTTPVLDRCTGEELVRTAACVGRDSCGWRVWYAGGGEFVWDGDRERPTYALRHARSDNGVVWRDSTVIFPVERDKGILGFGRPFVHRRSDGSWRMFYSLRLNNTGYLIRHAVSEDGLHWTHDPSLDLLPDGKGNFDSDMTCFASIVDTVNGTFMFYNGSDYGRTGFGIAILELGSF